MQEDIANEEKIEAAEKNPEQVNSEKSTNMLTKIFDLANYQNSPNPQPPQLEKNNNILFNPTNKEKKRRRTKNDQEGRNFICDICQKSYLSAPALSSHKKLKHFSGEEKKGRGRPRKYV